MMSEGIELTQNKKNKWEAELRDEGTNTEMCLQQVRMTVEVKVHAKVSQLLSPETSKMLRKGRKEGWIGCESCKIMAGTGSSYLEKSKLSEPFTTKWTTSKNF